MKKNTPMNFISEKIVYQKGKNRVTNGCHTSPENTKNMGDMKYWEGGKRFDDLGLLPRKNNESIL